MVYIEILSLSWVSPPMWYIMLQQWFVPYVVLI